MIIPFPHSPSKNGAKFRELHRWGRKEAPSGLTDSELTRLKNLGFCERWPLLIFFHVEKHNHNMPEIGEPQCLEKVIWHMTSLPSCTYLCWLITSDRLNQNNHGSWKVPVFQTGRHVHIGFSYPVMGGLEDGPKKSTMGSLGPNPWPILSALGSAHRVCSSSASLKWQGAWIKPWWMVVHRNIGSHGFRTAKTRGFLMICQKHPETLYSWPQTLATPIFKVCAKHSNMVWTRTSAILLGLIENTFPAVGGNAAMGSFLVFPTISRFPIAPVSWRTSVAKVSSPACLGVRSKPW